MGSISYTLMDYYNIMVELRATTSQKLLLCDLHYVMTFLVGTAKKVKKIILRK
jgi:hypothetical protein